MVLENSGIPHTIDGGLSHLEKALERSTEIAGRLRLLSDHLVGTEPMKEDEANPMPSCTVGRLLTLVELTHRALHLIEYELSRAEGAHGMPVGNRPLTPGMNMAQASGQASRY